MIVISKAFRPTEPAWQPVIVTTVHRAVPVPPQLGAIPVSPGIVIWTPPSPGLVRAFSANDDSADPIVFAGGATTLTIGIQFGVGSAQATLIPANVASAFAVVVGWGAAAPTVAVTAPGIQDSGVLVFPAGTVPGRVTVPRAIVAFTNAGTATGTLRFRFEFRPFVGGLL